MGAKRTQHHCTYSLLSYHEPATLDRTRILTTYSGPVCKVVAKPRCFTKGHLVHCTVHDVYHNPRSECAQCKGEEQRAERPTAQKSKSKAKGKSKGKSRGKKKDDNLAERAQDGAGEDVPGHHAEERQRGGEG